MPGILQGYNRTNGGYLETESFLLGLSVTIRAGDIILLCSSNSVIYARPAVAADGITSSWAESGTVKGILGMAMHDAVTDSSGRPVGQISPAGSGAPPYFPTYGLGSYASGLPVDPATGRGKILVGLANANNVFRVSMISSLAATTIKKSVNMHKTYGLSYNQSGFTNRWMGDIALPGLAGPPVFEVVDIDEAQPTYNVSSNQTQVFFKFLSTMRQQELGTFWTTNSGAAA